MATKKTSKKAPVKAVAKKTTTAKTESRTTVKRVVAESAASAKKQAKLDSKLPSNLINIVIAEIVGTFVLTLVALLSASLLAPLYIGLALVLLVLVIGAVSGAHVNPAVTFGLWTMRKLKTILVPFYWGAQFLGAMAAVVVIGALTQGAFALQFDQFMNFSWSIFTIELVGAAVFMFGIAAAITHKGKCAKAFGVGLALMVGLLVSGTLTSYLQSVTLAKAQKERQQNSANGESRNYPREIYISGATLNPAVSLAVTEKTDSQLQNNGVLGTENEKSYSRLSLEVILATLIGAALGGNLYLLVSYRTNTEE